MRPGRKRIDIIRGEPFPLTFVLRSAVSKAPQDNSGLLVSFQVLDNPGGSVLVTRDNIPLEHGGQGENEHVVLAGNTGLYSLWLTPAQTALLPAGSWYYRVRIGDSVEHMTTRFHGEARVVRP